MIVWRVRCRMVGWLCRVSRRSHWKRLLVLFLGLLIALLITHRAWIISEISRERSNFRIYTGDIEELNFGEPEEEAVKSTETQNHNILPATMDHKALSDEPKPSAIEELKTPTEKPELPAIEPLKPPNKEPTPAAFRPLQPPNNEQTPPAIEPHQDPNKEPKPQAIEPLQPPNNEQTPPANEFHQDPNEEPKTQANEPLQPPNNEQTPPAIEPHQDPNEEPKTQANEPLGQTLSPKPATTSSFLGDEYSSDNMHGHSKCPNNTRDKLRASFREQFIESLPLFQWKRHATESEYTRLSRYHGAYGWRDVPWEVVKETLELLNSTTNSYMFDSPDDHPACTRCAVVGNGGILNGSRMGKEIEDHDYVFRVNGAVIQGFEEDVGMKTSFYFFSIQTFMDSLVSYADRGFNSVPGNEDTRFLLLPDDIRNYLMVTAAIKKQIVSEGQDLGIDPTSFFGKNLPAERFKIVHPDFVRYLTNTFLWDPILETDDREIYRPSTGAVMLMAAIHACDQVDAYGFLTSSYAKYSKYYHDIIHEDFPFYMNHNFEREMKLWEDLHRAGVIRLYTRTEGQ